MSCSLSSNRLVCLLTFICLNLCNARLIAQNVGGPAAVLPAPVAALVPDDLEEFSSQPERVKKLIVSSFALTRLGLSYKYGSADPKNGGMDCSGTIDFLLKQNGFSEVPRNASELYKWVWNESRFQAVLSLNPNTFELSRMKPGDLLFWTGTYAIDRDPPVTHVMIYLGTNRLTKRRVMFGASEHRAFNGQGVTLFDFAFPRLKPPTIPPEATPRFAGYGAIPGL